MKNAIAYGLLSVACIVPAGCSMGQRSSLPYMTDGAPLRALSETGAGKITHVIYIVQENRSFDNLFQGFPGADTPPTWCIVARSGPARRAYVWARRAGSGGCVRVSSPPSG